MLAVLLAVCLLSSVGMAAPAPTADVLWPRPQSLVCSDGGRALADTFAITTTSGSPLLKAAIKRYEAIVKEAAAGKDGESAASSTAAHAALETVKQSALSSVAVSVASDAEDLTPQTDYSYTLVYEEGAAEGSLKAPTVFGAVAGLETLSQLVDPNATSTLLATACTISDFPAYVHRGLLVDSGRRFMPVALLKDLLDSMAYSKFNVMHLHLSDWAAVRLEIAAFPELTSGLDGQFYTVKDAAELVAYAKARGIRIVPEIDVPAHSAGFAPLMAHGLEFCDDTKSLLFNDPATNTTLKLVTQVLQAVGEAFPDALFHLGGDETIPVGKCSFGVIHEFERSLQAAVQDMKRQPAVWNEVFSNPPASIPNGAASGTIVQNWHDSASGTTAKAGFQSLVSTYNQLYLDQQCCAAGNAHAADGNRFKQCFYFDIATGVAASDLHLMTGGETAMWTDMYCGAPHCPQQGPWAQWYTAAYDKEFSESFASLTFPRAAAAAGSFWHFDATLATDSPQYLALIDNHNRRLTARGSTTCPVNCACDWNSKCGKPYGTTPPNPMAVTLINNASININIKESTPCKSGAGALIQQLKPGDSIVVHQDFIAVTAHAEGDPFDLWWGGPGWRSSTFTYNLTIDEAAKYIEYSQVMS